MKSPLVAVLAVSLILMSQHATASPRLASGGRPLLRAADEMGHQPADAPAVNGRKLLTFFWPWHHVPKFPYHPFVHRSPVLGWSGAGQDSPSAVPALPEPAPDTPSQGGAGPTPSIPPMRPVPGPAGPPQGPSGPPQGPSGPPQGPSRPPQGPPARPPQGPPARPPQGPAGPPPNTAPQSPEDVPVLPGPSGVIPDLCLEREANALYKGVRLDVLYFRSAGGCCKACQRNDECNAWVFCNKQRGCDDGHVDGGQKFVFGRCELKRQQRILPRPPAWARGPQVDWVSGVVRRPGSSTGAAPPSSGGGGGSPSSGTAQSPSGGSSSGGGSNQGQTAGGGGGSSGGTGSQGGGGQTSTSTSRQSSSGGSNRGGQGASGGGGSQGGGTQASRGSTGQSSSGGGGTQTSSGGGGSQRAVNGESFTGP